MNAVRAEWTKLRSVPAYLLSLGIAAGLMILFAVMISSGTPGTYDEAPYVDRFRFVHRPLTGDGSIQARVVRQDTGHPWAMAGIMIKARAASGAPYAAMMVTPGHGIRLQAMFTTDVAGSAVRAPYWLRLTRTGGTITGYESADGTAWRRVGAVTMPALPPTAEIGLFATDPGAERVVPMRPVLLKSSPTAASFDNVSVTPRSEPQWLTEHVGGEIAPEPARRPDAGGVVTVAGLGDILGQADDGSRVIAAAAGSIAAVIPLVGLGASFVTGEYQHGMIRTTFAARPRRGQVLAAKAAVLGAASFGTALAAVTAAFLLTQPLLRRHFRPPIYPDPSLTDLAVLRVIVGTAAVLALMTLYGLGVGALLRRSAAAVTTAVTLAIGPALAAPFLGGLWPQRWGPLAGLSIQQVKETDDAFLLPWVGRPWVGFAVLCVYVTIVLGLGYAVMRSRDA